MQNKDLKIVFFGTPKFAVEVLDGIQKEGIVLSLIVTTPDKPQGRKMLITPSPTKVWAEKNNIPILQPEKLDDNFFSELSNKSFDLFIVSAYGKIIPERFLNIPKFKSLNVHPSLLPHFRGASPIESVILKDEKTTGVSIMLMDKEMDHGPILIQEKLEIVEWPKIEELSTKLAHLSAKLLIKIIPEWVSGNIIPEEQDHSKATFTKKIKKEDGLIDFSDDPYLNFRKIMAYKAYFFVESKRVVVTEAKFIDGKLIILKVIPESRKEISYEDFKKTNV